MSMTPDISVVLVTYNCAGQVRECLDSVRWADEIVVVDLGSTDQTADICREFTSHVYPHAWAPYADPLRNEAFALARGRWILMLDPDERVTPGLAAALCDVVRRDEVDVVLVPWLLMAFGYARVDPLAIADRLPRFFRAGSVSWPREVHGRPDLTGLRQQALEPTADVYLLHDSWRDTDEILDKVTRYTAEEARLLHSRGVRFSVGRLLGETAREIGRSLMYQSYRNGTMGVVATGMSVMYRWTVWTRLWELENRPRAQDACVRRWGAVLGLAPVLSLPLYRFLRTRMAVTRRNAR